MAVGAVVVAATVTAPGAEAAAQPGNPQGQHGPGRHVLLLSIDGLHQTDLTWYERHYPRSALAELVRGGVDFTNARTPVPSDSFPGLLAQVTGGNPRTTGVYYDVSYNHHLLPAGTTDCAAAKPGAVVAYDESIDKGTSRLDAGQGLHNLPRTILRMTGSPQRLINAALLPVDPATCRPVYPHSYLKVNTVFNVARAHGLRTAWSDKHPAYEILNGPSGHGVQDLFTPEVNSDATGYPSGDDWTSDNTATRQYDSYKVRAVLNEIGGYDHSGRHHVGVPAIFGMNFQTVSTAQKLPTSDGLLGGYLDHGTVPGPLLRRALFYVNQQVGAMVAKLYARGLGGTTTIIMSAKHGQSPTDRAALTRVDDGPIISGINAAWHSVHPHTGDLVAAATDDDVLQLWLTDRSQPAADFVRHYLLTHPATGNDVNGKPTTVRASGLRAVYAGAGSAGYFHVPASDPRHPDIFGVVQHGVVYTGGTSKIAEHGGAGVEDRAVPIVVSGPGLRHGAVERARVETTRIAPTILRLLGVNPRELAAVRAEHTPALPVSAG